jgi:sarcosine oxidase subunit beta
VTTTADVVVIGAGILGAATARDLSARGLEVIVFDAGAANGQGSGATAGNVHIQGIHTRRPGQDIPVDVSRLLPLQRAAHDGWLRWQAELGGRSGYTQSGGWMVAETEAEVDDLRRKQAWESAAGIPTEVADGDAVRKDNPALGQSVLGATRCDWDGFADPAVISPALLGDATSSGARLIEHTAVTAIRRLHDGWAVTAGTDVVHCGRIIDVAGPWLADVARLVGVELALSPLAIQMFTTAPARPTLTGLIQHVAQGMSVKQTKDGRLMVGGGWPAGPMRPDGRADVDPAGLAGSLAQAARVIPALAQLSVDRAWAGPLAATPDEMPLIGELPGHPGFYIAGGTYAFTFAPVWARALTALVAGEPDDPGLRDLGPERLLISTAT